MSKPELYFAHSMSDYGTAWEAAAVAAIAARFPGHEVINPNRPDFDAACKREGFGFFLRRVRQCDMVVWSGFPDGAVGSGVAKEVEVFVQRKRPVLTIGRDLTMHEARPPCPLSIDATRARVRAAGVTGWVPSPPPPPGVG